jgi:hypothetical protein
LTYEAERLAIETRFNASWATATEIAWDNVEYTPTQGTDFVRLTIIDGDSSQVSLGNSPLHRSIGIIDIGIFVSLNSGTASARGYADRAAAIFREAQFSGILCRSPAIYRIGENDGWFQYNVTVPFHRDENF